MKKYFALSLFVLLALVLAACAAEATPEPTPEPVQATAEPVEAMDEEMEEKALTIVDIAVEDGRFTTLVSALQETGLVDALQAEGPFTVFAPTDDAFAALPEGKVDELLADKDALTSVLLYHVVEGKNMAADVVVLDGQEVATMSGESVLITIQDSSVMVNESTVIIPDIEASNGVIHVIDQVLLPPNMMEESMEMEDDMAKDEEMGAEEMSIVDIAVADGRFTTLVAAVTEAGLAGTLAGEGSFTVFAPTDDAFAALPEGTVEALLADKDALSNVLLYHVLDGEVLAANVVELDGQKVETLQGQNLDIMIDGENVMVNESQVIITDIIASNGVIHVIDAVLVPETRTIAEIAAETEGFSTLVAALDAVGLVDALNGEGQFTVFAPTDDAFAALPEGTVEGLLEDTDALTNVLLYHVADGKKMASEVVMLDGSILETLQGQNVDINVAENSVTADDAMIITTDIEAANGVIHVIDAVILPETRTIAQIASETEGFSTLVTALQAAGLVDALNADGEFTVFAPTDDAFAALPDGALDELVADTEALTDVLLYHVVDGMFMSLDVLELDGQEVETLSGSTLLIVIEDENVKINDAMVIAADIEASNGVIHVIDSVLLP